MLKKNRIKIFLECIKATPFHPQWFVFRKNNRNICEIADLLSGNILDIGCGEKTINKYLPDDCRYIGLDYYITATEWYGSSPEIFGDAQSLSFADKSIDCVLLLDVMEHLPDPDKCLIEVRRVLVEGGVFIILVPFLYPIHDSPLDFGRWTLYGLREILNRHGFSITEEKHNGNVLESAGLLMNIALSKTILNWIRKKSPAALLVILLPFIVFIINISTWLLTYISPADDMMPWGYRIVLVKR